MSRKQIKTLQVFFILFIAGDVEEDALLIPEKEKMKKQIDVI